MARKDTIFLHPGMHKTATTAIQAGLKDFTDGHTRYARLGLANHSIAMMTAFAADPARHMYYVKRGTPPEDIAARRAAIRATLREELDSPERNLVISGEEMSYLFAPDLRDMRDLLGQGGAGFRILAYIREPVGYASSAFQQIVRHRKVKRLRIPRPEYRRRFDMFLDVFGRDAVDFVPFHMAGFRNACVVTDFCDRLGVDADSVPKLTKNESLSDTAVALLLDWNRHGKAGKGSPAHVRAANRLIGRLRRRFPGRFRFARALIETERDQADCDWLESRAGFALPPAPDDSGGIGSLDEVTDLARAARPDLQALLDAAGTKTPATEPAAMLDALFDTFLEQVKAEAP